MDLSSCQEKQQEKLSPSYLSLGRNLFSIIKNLPCQPWGGPGGWDTGGTCLWS